MFYVDYGNTEEVSLSDLFKWNVEFDRVPYRATCFELLFGIFAFYSSENRELIKKTIQFHFLNRICTGIIQDSYANWLANWIQYSPGNQRLVRFELSNGMDVFEVYEQEELGRGL